ncbi:MAG TPA: SirB2 family protein [Burkholderiales bacterium]|nr:SirB2 family protein [Burkholderiales bacterium]
MVYAAVKELHVAAVALSWTLFFLRGVWMIADSPRLKARWVRVVPHVNDTILLVAGVYLATLVGLQPWIVAKLVALVAYILIGMVAISRGRRKSMRIAAWVAAQCVFLYIVAVALRKNPLPLP